MKARTGWLLIAAVALAAGCRSAAAGTEQPALTVMFIGNSLTYTNDLPSMIAGMARHEGRAINVVSITAPGFSLEDHWLAGAADSIRQRRPDFVVLQQGPSSLAESRAQLVEWAGRFGVAIRSAGGTPVLYMVWPEQRRSSAFPAVIESYSAAATAAGMLLAPAGAVWAALLEQAPDIDPYGPDGFHPARSGTLASALTIYAVMFGVDPLHVRPAGAVVPAATLRRLQEVVANTLRDTPR